MMSRTVEITEKIDTPIESYEISVEVMFGDRHAHETNTVVFHKDFCYGHVGIKKKVTLFDVWDAIMTVDRGGEIEELDDDKYDYLEGMIHELIPPDPFRTYSYKGKISSMNLYCYDENGIRYKAKIVGAR